METTLEQMSLSPNDVPEWYVVCCNSGCPMRDNCMRYQAGTTLQQTSEWAKCVLPNVLKDGQCRWFDQVRTEEMARGFSHLFDHVYKADFTHIRKAITTILHGTKFYYACKRGERAITPAQQTAIRNLLKRAGYPDEGVFDRYERAFKFGDRPTS